MPINPLDDSTILQANSLIAFAEKCLTDAPERLSDSIHDIINTLTAYIHSDDDEWPQYRVNVPFDYVYSEFASRLKLWRYNKVVSFQNDDAPKLSMAERATATLNDGGYNSYVIENNIGIHVAENGTEAVAYLDNHFLGHPYSAILGEDDSVVFTILDSTHYPSSKYSSTEYGTMMLSVEQLQNRIVEFSAENETYAGQLSHLVKGE